MIQSPEMSWSRAWIGAFLITGTIHAASIGALFVRFVPAVDLNDDLPAIAVEMAPPAALPAPVQDVPTPNQVEAPKQTPRKQPRPDELPFEPPPQQRFVEVKPEVVLQSKQEQQRKEEKDTPLPPAPTTTELASPDRKPDTKTTALLTDGVSAGKASAADMWDARVRARIEITKRYPVLAARQGQQDEVDVLLTLDRGGRLLDARVRSSRGFSLLNDAALDAVRRASPFPKPPKEIEGEQVRLSVIVRFFKRV